MNKLSSIAKYIKPADGFLLVEILDEQSTKFSVTADEIPQKGKVLRIGEATYRDNIPKIIESPAEVGDVVIHTFGYEDVEVKGQKLRLIPFSKVISVIKEKDYGKLSG